MYGNFWDIPEEAECDPRWDDEQELEELGNCSKCGCLLHAWNNVDGLCIDCAKEQE